MGIPPKGLTAANLLSIARVVLILPISLLLVREQTTAAVILLGAAALTDLLDGPVARRLGTQSSGGANLDGLADVLFFIAVLVWTWRLFPELWVLVADYLLLVAPLGVLYYILSFRRTGRILFLHLITGKLLGVLLYLLVPLQLLGGVGSWYIHVAGVTGVLYFIESILCLFRKDLDPDVRSAFF
jgi:cardiolipin synthase (CMP-forming)